MNDIQGITELRERTSLPLKDCAKALREAGDVEGAIVLLKQWGELKGKEKAHKIATEGIVKTFSNDSRTVVGILELNCQTDFVSRSREFNDLAAMLCNADFNETKFESARHDLIARTGENIVLRRKEVYTHKEGEHTYRTVYEHPGNRLAVIVEFESQSGLDKEYIEFTDDIAMQIAAMAPVAVSKEHLSQDMLDKQRAIFEGQLREESKPEAAWPKIIEGKFGKWRKDVCLLEQESIKTPKTSVEQMKVAVEKAIGCEITIKRFVRYALGEGQEVAKENFADEAIKMLGGTEAKEKPDAKKLEFPSNEWATAYKNALNHNPTYKHLGKDWTHGVVALIVRAESHLHTDDAICLWLDIHRGTCIDCKIVSMAAAQTAQFVIEAPYARWKQVIKKELEPIKGLVQGKLKLTKGHMPTIVKFVDASRELVESASLVPTAFRDDV